MAVHYEIVKITHAPRSVTFNQSQSLAINIEGLRTELNRLGLQGYKFVAVIDGTYILLQRES